MSGKPGRRLAETVSQALPPLFPTLGGALVWGLAMGGSALATLMLAQWETPYNIRVVVVLFAIGGAIAFPFGLFLARLLSTAGRRETAFAAMLLSLAIATIAATSGLFALQYRSYYAEWHAEAFSRIWFLQFIHTVAAAALSVRGFGPEALSLPSDSSPCWPHPPGLRAARVEHCRRLC